MLTRFDAERHDLFLAKRLTDPKGLSAYHVLTSAFTGKLPHPSAVHNIILLFRKGETKTLVGGV